MFEQVCEERFEQAYEFYRPYLWSVIYRGKAERSLKKSVLG
jgi:hypothetical protein